ncbi:hypothetical protein CCHR01_03259 [Colletotrichum chrysophilum]|uniref:Uncharacterized protein n=1 Tax=Colletotrichum chrysophilum TaxID=1836956 RepID=A0AAD9AT56_9PEZI|nr:hypothetical protein CCHR01_03259 [Colletotrichum chrysophilum]
MTRGCVSLGWLPVLQLLESPSSRPLEFALLVARSCRREDDNCLVFLSRMPTMGLGPSLQQIEPNEVLLTQHGSAPHYKHLGLGCCEKYMPKWLMGWEPLFSSQRLHITTLSVIWPPFRLKDGISGWLTFSIVYLLCLPSSHALTNSTIINGMRRRRRKTEAKDREETGSHFAPLRAFRCHLQWAS